MRRCARMGSEVENQTDHAALAREAEPVRRWLIGFFRRRIGGSDDVEDLAQEVFARIVSRNSPTPVGNLGGYILRTATSVLADRARRRATRQTSLHVVLDPDLHGDEGIDPERVLSGKEELNAATAALLSLPERTRTIFVLRRLEGWSLAEIARHQEISISAVEKHVVKAIQHLSLERDKRNAS